eukprot:scaffold63079_cov26-Tisochrysis_lutea.AAC.2
MRTAHIARSSTRWGAPSCESKYTKRQSLSTSFSASPGSSPSAITPSRPSNLSCTARAATSAASAPSVLASSRGVASADSGTKVTEPAQPCAPSPTGAKGSSDGGKAVAPAKADGAASAESRGRATKDELEPCRAAGSGGTANVGRATVRGSSVTNTLRTSTASLIVSCEDPSPAFEMGSGGGRRFDGVIRWKTCGSLRSRCAGREG